MKLRAGLIILLTVGTYIFAAQKKYYALIVAFCGIYTIAISGLDILFGYTGQISFGHAGFFAAGAYTSAILATKMAVTPVMSILCGIVLSVLLGVLVAFPASKLVKHFLSLLTIAFGQVVYLILNSARDFTGGGSGIRKIPDISLGFCMIDTNLKYAVFIWLVVMVIFAVKNNIVNSSIGYAFRAIKENSVAANGLGINTRKYKVMAFALSAGFTGLAGGLYAHLVSFISPDTFNSAQSMLFMTMLLFGGTCSCLGSMLGSIVLIIIREYLQSFSNYQTLIYGIFLLLVIFYFPNGAAGIFRKAADTWRTKGNHE